MRTARRERTVSPAGVSPAPETAALETYFLDMLRIRRFEERAAELFKSGVIKGTAHSCVGQEAIAVGACAALRDDDYVVSHHRGHGHCIAKGADTGKMMAELFGRVTGYGHGLGGSMHIAALEHGILGANGIVGAGLGIGTGSALSARIRGSDQVTVVFFGDGAANEGIFHESLNLAALWKLPVIFVCENNGYGLSLGVESASAEPRLSLRAAAYGMPGETIDGNDATIVRDAVEQAAERARAGQGPSLIEAMTYRFGDHSMRTNLPRYRPEAEEEAWRQRDPILTVAEQLRQRQVAQDHLDAIAAKADAEIEQAIAAAGEAPEPTMEILHSAVMAPSPESRDSTDFANSTEPRRIGLPSFSTDFRGEAEAFPSAVAPSLAGGASATNGPRALSRIFDRPMSSAYELFQEKQSGLIIPRWEIRGSRRAAWNAWWAPAHMPMAQACP